MLAVLVLSSILAWGETPGGPYDQFKMSRVRLNQLGLLSLTLGCSTFWQNWQHKQTLLSSLSLNFLRLINPDNPYETPFKQPWVASFLRLIKPDFYFPLIITIFVSVKVRLIKPKNFFKIFCLAYLAWQKRTDHMDHCLSNWLYNHRKLKQLYSLFIQRVIFREFVRNSAIWKLLKTFFCP